MSDLVRNHIVGFLTRRLIGSVAPTIIKDIQTSVTLFFALFSKLIVYKCIKYILHHVQK